MTKNIYMIMVVLLISTIGLVMYEKAPEQKSIYVVSMTADEMSTSLKNGSIDGFISWEPNPAKSVMDGYGRYLLNSKDVWENHPSCVLAISSDLMDENLVNALVWVHVKSTRFINDPANREKVLKYGMDFSGLDSKTVSAAINNTVYIEYPDLEQIKKGIEIAAKAGVFQNSIDSLGYKNVDEFLDNLFYGRYYNEMSLKLEKDPEWTPPPVNRNIRFGYIEGNIHYLAMYIAQKEGYFEKVGLVPGKNIQFTSYRSGRAITEAFKHREVDVATLGSTVLLRYRINDNGRVRVISGMNSGGSSLVVGANSSFQSIDDLNGHKIATHGFGTCQDTLIRKMFEGFEIKTI